MGTFNNEIKETLVINADNLNAANIARRTVMNAGKRLWVFVSKDKVTDLYGVWVANEFGGRVTDEELEALKDTATEALFSAGEHVVLSDVDVVEQAQEQARATT